MLRARLIDQGVEHSDYSADRIHIGYVAYDGLGERYVVVFNSRIGGRSAVFDKGAGEGAGVTYTPGSRYTGGVCTSDGDGGEYDPRAFPQEDEGWFLCCS